MASNTTLCANTVNVNTLISNAFQLGTEQIIADGDASTSIPVTLLNGTTKGSALLVALPNADSDGQLKVFINETAHSQVITPVTESGEFTTITMNNTVGCAVVLVYTHATGWNMVMNCSGETANATSVAGQAAL
jgi:hypothetical protein